MSIPNNIQIDSRYATPGQVDSKIAAQATTDVGQYAQQWKANTVYAANQIVIAPDGSTVSAVTGFTSSASYNSSNWSVLSPTLTTVNNALSLKANTASLATVATSGSYNDLTSKPTINTPNVQSYLVGGSYTWTKPTGYTFADVTVIGGGGGGGSGRRGASTTIRCGGGGGSSGARAFGKLLLSDLPSSVAITVSTGGAGGSVRTTDDTDGNPGSVAMNNTSFGTYLRAGSSTAASAGGTASSGVGAAGAGTGMFVGVTGGSANTGGGIGNGGTSISSGGPGGGGGGGGITSGNTTNNGGVGGTALVWTAALPTPGTIGGQLPLADPTPITGNPGQGGSGGAASRSANAQAGADGIYGSGGGGGGASENGFNSGAGGKGGDGVVLVICY